MKLQNIINTEEEAWLKENKESRLNISKRITLTSVSKEQLMNDLGVHMAEVKNN